MSATQELIAAALSAADELGFIYKHAPVEHSTDDIREACARAMMQPDIAEVERLVDSYRHAVWVNSEDRSTDADELDELHERTALLDYVRDHFGDADKMVQPVGEVPMPEADMRGPIGTGVYFNGYTPNALRTYGDAREAAGYAAGVAAVRDYAVMRWKAEVDLRPLENKHRRTLDDVWRQVISYTGGDPVALIGPCHDALAALRGEVKP